MDWRLSTASIQANTTLLSVLGGETQDAKPLLLIHTQGVLLRPQSPSRRPSGACN